MRDLKRPPPQLQREPNWTGIDGWSRERLRRDARSDAPPLHRLRMAFELATGRSAAFSNRRWGKVAHRALRRYDRFADDGRAQPGAGACWVIDRIFEDAQHPHGVPWADYEVPGSLAYYIVELDQRSKHLMHGYKRRRSRVGGDHRGSSPGSPPTGDRHPPPAPVASDIPAPAGAPDSDNPLRRGST